MRRGAPRRLVSQEMTREHDANAARHTDASRWRLRPDRLRDGGAADEDLHRLTFAQDDPARAVTEERLYDGQFGRL